MSASQRDIVGVAWRASPRETRRGAPCSATPVVGVTASRVRDLLLRHVEHHQVLRQRQRALVVLADLALDLRRGVEVVEEVIDHGLPRLHQLEHLAALLRRGVRHGADADRALLRIAGALDQLLHGVEAFVDQQIGALGVVDKELARRGVAGEHEAKPVPLQPIAHRAVVDVDRREAFDDDAVLVVDHAGLGEIELVDLDLGAGVRQQPEPRLGVPDQRLHLLLARNARCRISAPARTARRAPAA